MQFGRNSSAISIYIDCLKKKEILINLSSKTHWFGKLWYKMVRKHKLEDNSGTITCMYDWLSMNERRGTTCDTIYNICHSQTKCTLTNIDQIESLQLVHFFVRNVLFVLLRVNYVHSNPSHYNMVFYSLLFLIKLWLSLKVLLFILFIGNMFVNICHRSLFFRPISRKHFHIFFYKFK